MGSSGLLPGRRLCAAASCGCLFHIPLLSGAPVHVHALVTNRRIRASWVESFFGFLAMAREDFHILKETWLYMYTHIQCRKSECVDVKDKWNVQCFVHIKMGRQHEAERMLLQCGRAACSAEEKGRTLPYRKSQG